MLKKLYEKSRIWFALIWIISYCVLMSLGDALSELVGIGKSATLAIGILMSAVILLFLKKNGLFGEYGLCAPRASAKSMLYYLPIIIMLSANLWFGVSLKFNAVEKVLYVLSMLSVGFLEEIIFRGFLFRAMSRDSLPAAVIVSSFTFGMGHIINLFNGSGAELLPNLLQVIYATAAGFMFVMIFHKTKSLVVCIAAHEIFNALSAFSSPAAEIYEAQITSCIFLTVITGAYAAYIAFGIKKEKSSSSDDRQA